MTTFKVPKEVCKDMDALVRKFWWGGKKDSNRYLALKKWSSICLPREKGGLRFYKFEDINSALLAKLGWNLVKGHIELWTYLLKAIYLSGMSFFKCDAKRWDSLAWKNILGGKDLVRKGACFRVGMAGLLTL